MDRRLRAAQLGYFALFDGPRGRGRPVPRTAWDAQWRDGYWDYLVSEDELPRYGVIAGYIRTMGGASNVLDVGCGHGHLKTVLGEVTVNRYHGIDLSHDAISQATASHGDAATFEAADLTEWVSKERYGVVVLNEVLYYVQDPVAAVERYVSLLHPGGLVIISMFRHGNTRLIWRSLERRFPITDAAEVKNRLGEVVDIKILRSPDRLVSVETAHADVRIGRAQPTLRPTVPRLPPVDR